MLSQLLGLDKYKDQPQEEVSYVDIYLPAINSMQDEIRTLRSENTLLMIETADLRQKIDLLAKHLSAEFVVVETVPAHYELKQKK